MKTRKSPKVIDWNTNAKHYKGRRFSVPFTPPTVLNEMPDSRRTVWEYLASRCVNKPWCWPSIRTIAKDINRDPKTVQNCIRHLQAHRVILFEPAPWMGKREKRRPVNIYFVYGMGINYAEARNLLRDKTSNWYLTGKRNNSHVRLYKEKGEDSNKDNPLPPLQGASGCDASFISDPDKGTVRPRFSWKDQHKDNVAPFAMGVQGVYCKDLSTDRNVSASEQGLMPDDPEPDTELDDLMSASEQGLLSSYPEPEDLMSPITDSVDESDIPTQKIDAQPASTYRINSLPTISPRVKKSKSRGHKTTFHRMLEQVAPFAIRELLEREEYIIMSGRVCGVSEEVIEQHCRGEYGFPSWAPTQKLFLESLKDSYCSGVPLGKIEELGVSLDSDLGDIWPLVALEGRKLTPEEIAQVVRGKLGALSEKQLTRLLERPEIRQRLMQGQNYSHDHSRDLVDKEPWHMGPMKCFENDLADGEIYPDVKSLAEWLWVLQQLYPVDRPEVGVDLVKQYRYSEQTAEFVSLEEQALETMPPGAAPTDEFWKVLVLRSKHRKTELRMLARPDFQAYLASKLGFPSYKDLDKAHRAGEISPTQFEAIDWWDALKNVLDFGCNEHNPKYEFAVDPTDNPQPLPAYADYATGPTTSTMTLNGTTTTARPLTSTLDWRVSPTLPPTLCSKPAEQLLTPTAATVANN